MKVDLIQHAVHGIMSVAVAWAGLLKLHFFSLTAQIADPGAKAISEYGALGIVGFVVWYTLTTINRTMKEQTDEIKALPHKIAEIIKPNAK